MEIKIFGTVEEIAALVAALQERRKEDALFLALGGDALGKHFPEEDKPMEKSRYEENARSKGKYLPLLLSIIAIIAAFKNEIADFISLIFQ